jgi:hypothetical protein
MTFTPSPDHDYSAIITKTSRGYLCADVAKSQMSNELLTGKLPPTPKRPPHYSRLTRESPTATP